MGAHTRITAFAFWRWQCAQWSSSVHSASPETKIIFVVFGADVNKLLVPSCWSQGTWP